MGSNLKHVVKRRVHLERSQPHDRKGKFPILEKHSDYVVRAKDYHKKQAVLRNLREKVRTRNPDEFYFKMVHSRLDDQGRFEKVPNNDETKDAKSKMSLVNRKIVNWKHSIELKGVEKLKENLHVVGGAQPKMHILFSDENESDDANNSAERHDRNGVEQMTLSLNEEPELPFDASRGRDAARLGIEALKRERKARVTPTSDRSIAEAAEAAEIVVESLAKTYESVIEKKNRVKTLNHALELLEREKNLASKDHVRVVKGSDGVRNIHVWRPSRKR